VTSVQHSGGRRVVTIIAYHYVRPLARTRFPGIKGCDMATFVAQVDDVASSHDMVSVEDLVAALDGRTDLPERAALLTFDDGFRDHFDYVLPVLHERGIAGCFFPPASAVEDHVLLDVHKAHFLLASGADPGAICDDIDAWVVEHRLGDPARFAADFRKPSPRDPAEVIYVKRMLQRGLPAAHRGSLASELFRRHVSADEAAFAEELYCTAPQLALMSRLGMHIGSHGHGHHWLSTLDQDAQRTDLLRSIEFLDRITGPGALRTLCYPYGDHDDSARATARSLGFSLALADHHGVANLELDDRWALPRISTSDYPLH
jgi:peptidoglycan/xylan/chitin deacetylase (PgdA/CDA1 family)